MLRIIGGFSSIGAKLFIYFWLIIVLTVGATRVVSEQFKSKSVIIPTHHVDIAKIARIGQLIKRNAVNSPQQVLAIATRNHNRELLLKNTLTNEVLAADKWQIESLREFLSENNLENHTTVKFEFYRMTGPLMLDFNGIPYQLFIASRDRKPHFGNFIRQIPTWLRIAIPVFISAILLWLLARSLTKPLIAMQRAAAKFGDGDFSARVALQAQRSDEIGACAISFNLMADKLEQNIAAHQRLMADVSHELRSPMTRLQIALGLAQQDHINEKVLHKHLQRCELEVARLDEMIANVLTLSRLENIINQMELMTVDLQQLITLCIEDAQYMANEKSVSITFQHQGTILIQADANLLASAIDNILVNAIKYSHNGDQLKVILDTTNKYFIINIIDTGTGIPANDLAKIFEPFYRVTQARDRATGGTGLGLAIAKQAIVAHNGNISAQNNSENGLTVTIELPLTIGKKTVNV